MRIGMFEVKVLNTLEKSTCSFCKKNDVATLHINFDDICHLEICEDCIKHNSSYIDDSNIRDDDGVMS
jgi:hypothetical protein